MAGCIISILPVLFAFIGKKDTGWFTRAEVIGLIRKINGYCLTDFNIFTK